MDVYYYNKLIDAAYKGTLEKVNPDDLKWIDGSNSVSFFMAQKCGLNLQERQQMLEINEEQEDVFPTPSVSVSVTELEPRLLQLNVDADKTCETMVQLSVLPLFTWADTIVADPEPFRKTVAFLQIGFGGKLSLTVITEAQVAVFPAPSAIVIIIGFAPIFAQVKLEAERKKVSMLQSSTLR